MSIFKVLTFPQIDELDDSYVDESKLNDGIYLISKPTLHASEETLESLIDKWIRYGPVKVEEAITNIKKCQLTNVILVLT